MGDRGTVRAIKKAVAVGALGQPFGASDVNALLGIDWAGTFLPKHCVGNPGGYTEHFVRIGRGLYRLKAS